jgi:hypothetical protein
MVMPKQKSSAFPQNPDGWFAGAKCPFTAA